MHELREYVVVHARSPAVQSRAPAPPLVPRPEVGLRWGRPSQFSHSNEEPADPRGGTSVEYPPPDPSRPIDRTFVFIAHFEGDAFLRVAGEEPNQAEPDLFAVVYTPAQMVAVGEHPDPAAPDVATLKTRYVFKFKLHREDGVPE